MYNDGIFNSCIFEYALIITIHIMFFSDVDHALDVHGTIYGCHK